MKQAQTSYCVVIPKVINQAWTQKAVKLYRQRQDDDINLEAFKIPNIFLRLSVSTLRRFSRFFKTKLSERNKLYSI